MEQGKTYATLRSYKITILVSTVLIIIISCIAYAIYLHIASEPKKNDEKKKTDNYTVDSTVGNNEDKKTHGNFSYHQKNLNGVRLFYCFINSSGGKLTYKNVMEGFLIKNDISDLIIRIMKESEYDGFYFETKKINKKKINDPFEFVLVETTSFRNYSPQPDAFKDHFKNASKNIVSFPNLKKNSILVSPVPNSSINNKFMIHLSEFIKNVDIAVAKELWS